MSLAPRPAHARQSGDPIRIEMDLSEAPRRILHSRIVMPARPGPLALAYPRWIPGEHGPTGPVTDLAGLKITAGGVYLPWKRDEINMFVIRCEVPARATAVEISLDFLSPPASVGGFSSAASATQQLAVLNWNQVVLSPLGLPGRDVIYKAALTLPPGWTLGTALPIVSSAGARTEFAPVSLETLVDSPVIAGAHFRELPIGPATGARHFIEIAADSREATEVTPDQQKAYDRLVGEAWSLFGAHHYDSYRFLLALSDDVAHFGLEHHESSDNRAAERALTDDVLRKAYATLLPHEFIHSWNGKYRRPADLLSPDFQQPMATDLLWVYEGLTQYLSLTLTARSGLWSPEEYREKLALIAQWASDRRGRAWRPLADTAVAAQLLFEARDDWAVWRRSTDFYDEGVLIWLDADTLIRETTQGRRSLDDFCRKFHGGQSGPPTVRPYTFEDVVATLNEVAPHDWRGFLTERLTSVGETPPLEGLTRAGWRLSYDETPSSLQKAYEKDKKTIDLSASLGIVLNEDGMVKDIVPGKPGDRAGIAPAMKLVAVNTRRWSADILRESVAATRRPGTSLELLMENGQFLRSHPLEYHEGAKYPRLTRIPGKDDLLAAIIRPGS
ncbi:MAG TPA: M61 family peptidase [Candidatus Polarisedimenticolia bacterium]|nr:M61 family peptidase [Candidatus Polarisedimenticolia bacterium]